MSSAFAWVLLNGAIWAASQQPAPRFDELPAPLQLTREYFRTMNLTVLAVDLGPLGQLGLGAIRLQLDHVQRGKVQAGSARGRISLHFKAVALGAKPRYHQNHAAAIKLDGEPMQTRSVRYEGQTERGLLQETIDVESAGTTSAPAGVRSQSRRDDRCGSFPAGAGAACRRTGVCPSCPGSAVAHQTASTLIEPRCHTCPRPPGHTQGSGHLEEPGWLPALLSHE